MVLKTPVTAAIIGAGNRGKDVYAQYALDNPNELQIVAVAEPNEARRIQLATRHELGKEMQFSSWEELFRKPKLADAVFICTQDQMHFAPAMEAMELGYHLILEKPMATSLKECVQIVKKAEESQTKLYIAHVLRYNHFFQTLINTVKSGAIGEIITIDHRENISYYHFAHSYVRGNWAEEEKSSPAILAKSCHDLDIIYTLVGEEPKYISSFGSLMHFNKGSMPRDAPLRCTDGCSIAETCKYYAPDIYIKIIPLLRIARAGNFPRTTKLISKVALDHPALFKKLKDYIFPFRQVDNFSGWPVSTITDDLSIEGKWNALKTGPYGRCVFQCSNNVVDHQVAILEFPSGITATFTMHGFSHAEGRTVRIDGTRGTIIGEALLSGEKLTLYDHKSGATTKLIGKSMNIDPASGHGGGDQRMLKAFLKSIRDPSEDILTSAHASLESHLMAFAAERARLSKEVILMSQFRKERIKEIV